jgi:hypothetical protein
MPIAIRATLSVAVPVLVVPGFLDLADEGLRMRTTIPDESVAAGPGTPDANLTDARRDEAEPIDTRGSRRSFVFFGALAAAALLPKRARAQSRQKGKRPIDTEPR